MQIACALILSHAGEKPLARYRVSLSDDCDAGTVASPITDSVKCLPPSVALSPRDRARQCRRAVTLYGWRIALRSKSGRFRFLKYARLGASHVCGASNREKLAEMAA